MPKLLLVEDDEVQMSFLSIHLEGEGYTLCKAVDGNDALQKLEGFKPDIIVCDIEMPNMGGLEFLTELNSRDIVAAETPFIFLSAYANQADVLRGLTAGADDYVTKPVNIDILMAKLNSLMRHAKRIETKYKEDQVKLYKVLSKGAEDENEDEPKPVPPSLLSDKSGLSILLVGKIEKELSATQKILTDEGHNVRVYSSGKEYSSKVGLATPDLTILWLYSDDMQAHFALKFARQDNQGGIGPVVLIWPQQLIDSAGNLIDDKLDEIVQSPFSWDTLKSSIKKVIQ